MRFIEKLTGWYFSKGALPYWYILLLDCLLVIAAGIVSYYIIYGGLMLTGHFWQLLYGIICCLPAFLFSFHTFHTYQGILRYSSFTDLVRISLATFTGCVLSYALGVIVYDFGVRPDVLLLPDGKTTLLMFAISTMFIWFVCIAVKGCFDSFHSNQALPAAIYGTQAGGIALAKSIKSMTEKSYIMKAFISDDKDIEKMYLLGHKVYLNGPGIGKRMKELGIKVLLVSPPKSEKFRNNQPMVNEILQAGIKVMMMPVAVEWDAKSNLSHRQLHEVEIEDLLPRDEIKVNLDAIGSMLSGKRVLITGAAGSIGSEMVRQIALYKPHELVLIDQAETPMHDIRLMMARQFADIRNNTIVGSITDKVHMEKIFSEHRPEYVFHAAAYKHVPMMEDNPAMAVRNNVEGTRIIADLAVKYGTKKFVMISTDKAVNPTNVMGCSKRICEIYCQSLGKAIQDGTFQAVTVDGQKADTQFVTTRFGNVLGSNGSVIPIFREQIKKGGPLTVTHPEIYRFFMLIPEACKLVLEAGTMGHGGEIFVFDMGKPVKIADLAKRMIELSGADNIEIKFTGLRDGEKLYEEVLNDKEASVPTHHPKIMIAKVRSYDYAIARRNEDELLRLSYTHDDMAIVRQMKAIVPEYKSKSSKYEVLD